MSQQRPPDYSQQQPPPKSGAGVLWIVTILFVGAIGFIIVKGTGILPAAKLDAPHSDTEIATGTDPAAATTAPSLGIKLEQSDYMAAYQGNGSGSGTGTEDTMEAGGLDIPSTGGNKPPGAGKGSNLELSGESVMAEEVPVKEMEPRHTAPMEGLTRYFYPKTFVVDNKDERHTLSYFLYKPRPPKGVKWPEDAKLPLVLVLHDSRGIAESGEYLLQATVRTSYPAYIVAPVLPKGMIWAFPSEMPDDPRLNGNLKLKQGLGDAVQLVQDIINNYPVDPKRVYVMGCAEGGFGAYGAALNYPDVFAAAVVISGGWTVKDTPKMKKVPIWAMHGDKDRFFAPGLSMNVVAYIQQMGGNVFWKSVPELGRDCSNQAFFPRALWPWMFQQKKK